MTPTPEQIEAWSRLAERLQQGVDPDHIAETEAAMDCAAALVKSQAEELASLRERVRMVLEPFAKLRLHEAVPDDAMLVVTSLNGGIIDTGRGVQIIAGNLRAARSLHAEMTARPTPSAIGEG